jgi:beta-lactamase regulating signal transducer with metallopeptidase domain/HEAT repeat protein
MSLDLMLFFIGVVIRSTLVLAVAWALTAVMRRSAASTRHFVWSCAIAASVLVAVPGLVGARVSVPVPAGLAPIAESTVEPISAASAAGSERTRPTSPVTETIPAGLDTATSEGAARFQPSELASTPAPRSLSMAEIAGATWIAGSLMAFAYLAVGLVTAWRVRGSATPIEAAWVDDARVLAEALEVPGDILFVESHLVTTPLIVGIWKPVIVMPREASTWSDERLRLVVLHELAHVKRHDCLTQTLARGVRALYWFNPLAWVAVQRLRAERERACDDFVLSVGTRASDYADHLLEIARSMRRSGLTPVPGLAMARPSQLEGRLLAILDPAIRRASTINARVAVVATIALLAVPLGTVQLQSVDETELAAESQEPRAESPALSARQIPTPDPRPQAEPPSLDPVSEPRLERAELPRLMAQEAAQAARQAIGAERRRNVPDAKTVDALIEMLDDPDPDVRVSVVHTLGRIRDSRVTNALLLRVKDEEADVRVAVASALLETDDPRAGVALTAMANDQSDDVRQIAIHSIARLNDASKVPLLLSALKDPSDDVRTAAAQGLGLMRVSQAVEPLIEALKDPSDDVRAGAAFALGHIGDNRALPGLTAALKDRSADVRSQAVHAIGQLSRRDF